MPSVQSTGSSQSLSSSSEQAAQQAIQAEQQQTIESMIEAKRNEGAFKRAMAWLEQSVG